MNCLSQRLLATIILCTTFSTFYAGDIQNAVKLLEEKKFEEAVVILENIIDQDENNDSAYYYLGKAMMGLREFEDASDYFEEAVELRDNNADYHFWLGQAYAMDAQQSNIISQAFLAPKILTQYERTVELDPNHLPGRIGLANFYMQAPGIMGGDLDKALVQGNTILGMDEKRGRLVIANVYMQKDMPDSAEVQMKIIKNKFGLTREFADFYNVYGYYLLEQNRIEEAIEKFLIQVELNPDHPNPYDSLGDAYRAAGRLKEAAEQYRKALEIDPEFEASKSNLEEVLEELEEARSKRSNYPKNIS